MKLNLEIPFLFNLRWPKLAKYLIKKLHLKYLITSEI